MLTNDLSALGVGRIGDKYGSRWHGSWGQLGSLLFDLNGSYPPAWMLSPMAGIVTAFIALDLASPAHPRQRHQTEDDLSASAHVATSSSPA
jgi:hypothetical protein